MGVFNPGGGLRQRLLLGLTGRLIDFCFGPRLCVSTQPRPVAAVQPLSGARLLCSGLVHMIDVHGVAYFQALPGMMRFMNSSNIGTVNAVSP